MGGIEEGGRVRAPPGGAAGRREPDQAAGKTTGPFEVYRAPTREKTGRARYLRFFPDRASFLLDQLSERQLVAVFRFKLDYVIRDGNIADDDRQNARRTKQSLRAWRELRALLLDLGELRSVDGWLIDDDVQSSLDLQNGLSERGRRAARTRWGGGRVA
jgi:hypothetical protein